LSTYKITPRAENPARGTAGASNTGTVGAVTLTNKTLASGAGAFPL